MRLVAADGNANGTAAVARPVLPAVDLDTLRLTQTVCDVRFARCAAQAGVELASVAVRDTAARVTASAPAAADPAVLTVTFRTPDAPAETARAAIEIDLDQYPLLRIALGPADAGRAASAPPVRQPALTLAVAALLVEPLFVQLGKLRFEDLHLAAIARGRLAQQHRGPFVHLAFSLPGTEPAEGAPRVRYEHLVSLPESAVRCVDALVRQAAVEPRFGTLPVPGRIVLGVKPLSIDTLARLQPGDVLLRALFPAFDARRLATHAADRDANRDAAGSPSGHAAPRAVAAWGTPGLVRLCATVEFDGTSPVIIKEPYMSDHLDSALADAGMSIARDDDLIRVGELELPVQFEIDTLAMPLSQLSALGPGYVIEFPVPFSDALLRLVAHGNTIGYGELVTVGEHLGVRIVRMAHNSGAAPGMDDGSV
ncbi:type III secretion system cytoplasmic ring protein SctQ [Paraburkholderia sp. B3]|uniref:type III secretion system cytoplasmic ring protein SctQ n=1 Tax=Paraburkholderia sp. B3 TaxID=3134791 RepID=UPI0039823918